MQKELVEKMDIMRLEYSFLEGNKNVGKTREKRESEQVKHLKRSVEYKGRTINVVLEFPTDTDNMEEMHSMAQQEFENLLKKMYMDRIKSELDKKD